MPDRRKRGLGNNTSDQKENRPKKVKTNKPDPDGGIALSKQLSHKKINNRRKRPTKNRVTSVGKPMPSLADLEKMYEDSGDDNVEETPVSNNIIQTSPLSTEPQLPAVIDVDALFSPNSRNAIKKQAQEIITLMSDNNTIAILPPPVKQLQFDDLNESSSCVSVGSIPDTSTHTQTHTPGCELNEPPALNEQMAPHTQNDTNVQGNINIDNQFNDNGNLSDSSTGSNKTIEYKLSPPPTQTESTVSTFCPLPSTSKDNVTIIKNDELYNESLIELLETKDALSENDDNDLEIIANPIETITIDDDEIDENPIIPVKCDTTTIDVNSDEDDDCAIVGRFVTNNPNESSVIILDQESLEDRINKALDNDDVIDIDKLIAENQSILNKYQNSNKSNNLIVDATISQVQGPQVVNPVTSTQSQEQQLSTQGQEVVDMLFNVLAAGTQYHRHVSEFQRNKSSSSCRSGSNSNNLQLSTQTHDESISPRPLRYLGDCPICMDCLGSKEIVSTICGHVFCKLCLVTALKSNGKKCPTCRKALKNKGSFHQIFL
ncbi:uncharacterized protein LOC142984311 [Anticarsia gemmatalis]|uniref:uncharacterized protein LOC142984311 n=1 Tax=Anticarsia gemmatalis TaxID=129554 RepID=UPI003F76443D